MERLTRNDLNYISYSTWELCGLDNACTRSCQGCHIPDMYRKLAEYEDMEAQGVLYREVWYIESACGYCLIHNCDYYNNDCFIIESKIVSLSELNERKYYLSIEEAKAALKNMKGKVKNE